MVSVRRDVSFLVESPSADVPELPSSAPFQRVNSAPPVPYDYEEILARFVAHDHDAPVVMPHSPEAYQTILAAIEKDVACLRRLRSLKT
jgi:hypothetical protein